MVRIFIDNTVYTGSAHSSRLFRLDIVENDRKIFQNNNLSSRAYLPGKAKFYATRPTTLRVYVKGNLLERASGKKEESLRVLLYVCFVEQARHALSTTPLSCHYFITIGVFDRRLQRSILNRKIPFVLPNLRQQQFPNSFACNVLSLTRVWCM